MVISSDPELLALLHQERLRVAREAKQFHQVATEVSPGGFNIRAALVGEQAGLVSQEVFKRGALGGI